MDWVVTLGGGGQEEEEELRVGEEEDIFIHTKHSFDRRVFATALPDEIPPFGPHEARPEKHPESPKRSVRAL